MSSSAAAERALEERGVFESFAQAAGLNVRPYSITQPDPPDIRCEIEVLGPVGFELVQLDVGDELQRMKYLGRGSEFCEDTRRGLPPDVLERQRRAQINVAFDSKANQSQRRGALKPIVPLPGVADGRPRLSAQVTSGGVPPPAREWRNGEGARGIYQRHRTGPHCR